MMPENEARLFFVIAVLIGTFALSLAREGLKLYFFWVLRRLGD